MTSRIVLIALGAVALAAGAPQGAVPDVVVYAAELPASALSGRACESAAAMTSPSTLAEIERQPIAAGGTGPTTLPGGALMSSVR